MSGLQRENLDNGVVRLSLATGSGNPLTPELLETFVHTLDDLERQPPRALVLDGGGAKLFSGGFDLTVIANYDRAEVSSFFKRFMSIIDRMIRLPSPTLVAIHSHALAGGFILALAFDFRIGPTQPVKLGLNEVDLGVAVPAGTQVMLAERTSPQASKRMSNFGLLIGPQEALKMGLMDELHEDPQARALEMATELAQKPGDGARHSKAYMAQLLADAIARAEEIGFEPFLDSWFSPAGQEGLKRVAERLRR